MAGLAKLALTEDEEKRLASEFQRIAAYVSRVQEIQAPVAPLLTTISGVQHVLRDDMVAPSSLADALLQCAPEAERRHVRVPPTFAADPRREPGNKSTGGAPRSLGEGGQASVGSADHQMPRASVGGASPAL